MLHALLAWTSLAVPNQLAATTVAHPPEIVSNAATEQFVIKGERHTGTNFLHTLLAHNFGLATCPGERDAQCALCSSHCVTCEGAPAEDDGPPTLPTPEERHECLKGQQACWKHGYACAACSDNYGSERALLPAHVFLVRSPYSWVLSMRERPYGMEGSFVARDGGINGTDLSAFLRMPVSDEQWHRVLPYDKRTLANGIPADEGGACYPDTHDNVLQLWNEKVRSYLDVLRPGSSSSSRSAVTAQRRRRRDQHGRRAPDPPPPAALAVNLTTDQLYDC